MPFLTNKFIKKAELEISFISNSAILVKAEATILKCTTN